MLVVHFVSLLEKWGIVGRSLILGFDSDGEALRGAFEFPDDDQTPVTTGTAEESSTAVTAAC